MGESALTSHMKGAKHRQLLEISTSSSMDSFVSIQSDVLQPTQSDLTAVHSAESMAGPSTQALSIEPIQTSAGSAGALSSVTRNDHLKAETLWALNVVSKNYSFKSCEGVGDLFREMFPDSEIAKQFRCGERKANYLVTFGVVPYLQSQLCDQIKKANDYVMLFDESLNDGLQSKQMDVFVRFWDGPKVNTRYYTSKFLGHAVAETLQDELYECCVSLGLGGIHQLSMDGPNVNWKAFDLLSTQIEQGTRRNLLNVGSCGLHIMHNSFRAGITETEWDVEHTLNCLYWLFKDAPARREDYITVTGSTIFALKFCPHRWVENVPVAERALEIWDNVKRYVSAVRAGSVPTPKNKSFKVICASADNNLFIIHLHIFLTIAKIVTPFLVMYQTDAPMLPFLRGDLHDLIRGLLTRFIKKCVLDKANTVTKLLGLDPTDQSQHVSSNSVDIGFAAEKIMREHKRAKKLSEHDCLSVRLDTKKCLIAMTKKLLHKCPVNYPLVRNLNWLVPDSICHKPNECVAHLKRCLCLLSESGHVEVRNCDDIIKQYNGFLRKAATQDAYLEFRVSTDRLDKLLYDSLANDDDMKKLWDVVRIILILSHGQATVERGFSVNKVTMVDNLTEHTLIAKRVVKDHVMQVGKISDIAITPALLAAAAAGRKRYQLYLDKQKKMAVAEIGEKRKANDELVGLKAKKKRVEGTIEALNSSADAYAEEAESTGRIELIAQSNSHRRSAAEKTKELKAINSEITTLEKKVKTTV